MLGQALPRLRTKISAVVPTGKPFSQVKSRYKDLQQIHSGAFGTAYKAVLNGKKVVVKVVHEHAGTGWSTATILRGTADEARILSKLQKFPFIPRLIEIGTDYFTMEDVDGVGMHVELSKGMTAHKGLSIVIAVGVMASLLHREGVAHSDLHPGNILLTPNGVVLIDFGVAVERDRPPTVALDRRKDFREGMGQDIKYLLNIIDIFTQWPNWPPQLINALVPLKNGFHARVERGEYDEETGKELARELSFIVAQLGAMKSATRLA